jgi:hypothetical protein
MNSLYGCLPVDGEHNSGSDSEQEQGASQEKYTPPVTFTIAVKTTTPHNSEQWQVATVNRRSTGRSNRSDLVSKAEHKALQEKERIANRAELHKTHFTETRSVVGDLEIVYHTINPVKSRGTKVTYIYLGKCDNSVRELLGTGFVECYEHISGKDGTLREYKHQKFEYNGKSVPSKLNIKLYYYQPVVNHNGALMLIYNTNFVRPCDIATAVDEFIELFSAINQKNTKTEPASEPASEPTSETTSKPAYKPAYKPASKPAYKPASEPASKSATEHVGFAAANFTSGRSWADIDDEWTTT